MLSSPGKAGNLPEIEALELVGSAGGQRFVRGRLGISQASLSAPTFCASTRADNSSCRLADITKLSRLYNSAESSGFQYSGL
jgi:hypothetical protein